jgi:hypothetical protein
MSINDAYADLMNEVTTLKAMLEKTTSQAAAMREALEFWVRNPTMGRGLGDVPHEQWSKMEAMTTRALDITDAGRRRLRELEALREVAEAARGPGGDYAKAWERLYAALERLDKERSVPENHSAFDPVAAERALKRADEVLGSFCPKCGAPIGKGRGGWMNLGVSFCSERCAREAAERDGRPLQSDWDHLVEDHASKCEYIEALVAQREEARLLLGGEKLSVEDALAGKRAATILELAKKCRDERDEARRVAEDQDEHSEQRAAMVKRFEEVQERSRTLEEQVGVLREALVKIATHTRPCEHSAACPGCIARDAILAVSPWERGRGPALVDLLAAAEVLGRIVSLEDYHPHATTGTDRQCAGPNHGHPDFRTWDNDNKPGLAGRECKWCRAWRDAAEVLAKIKAVGVK